MARGERSFLVRSVALLSLGLAFPLAAQLDDSCVVSALNRTAPVQPDGVWVLPNVPANQGEIRVRATCTRDGVTRSGQSDFFAVPANGVVEVAEIRFDTPQPVPASLRLSAPATTLASPGQTAQLSAIVTKPFLLLAEVEQTDSTFGDHEEAAVSPAGPCQGRSWPW